MAADINWTYGSDRSANIESSHSVPETNVMLNVQNERQEGR